MNFIFADHRSLQLESSASQVDETTSALLGDRGYLFGDGFFTTAMIDYGRIRHQEYHFKRLKHAAESLDFSRFDIDSVAVKLNALIKPVNSACVRITVSRQQSQRGYAYSDAAKLNISIQLSDPIDEPNNFCELILANSPISINPKFAGLKHLNRLDSVFAAKEIEAPHQESILCADDLVICGSRSNLFVRSQGNWMTPKIDRAGVNGITRQRIIESASAHGVSILQSDITKHAFLNCDAAFVTNSLIGFWPVAKIENSVIATQLSCELKHQLNFQR